MGGIKPQLHRARLSAVLPCWQSASSEGQIEIDAAPAPDDEDEGEPRPAPAAGSLLRTLMAPQVSVAIGVGILLAVLANRIATPELVDSQARTDILGVIASGGLITNGVYLLVRERHGRAPRNPRKNAP